MINLLKLCLALGIAVQSTRALDINHVIIDSKNSIADGPYGGDGGDYWIDNGGEPITAMRILAGGRIDGIQVKYGNSWSLMHGGSRSGEEKYSEYEFELQPGDEIFAVEGRSNSRVDQLYFRAVSGRTYGPYGGDGGNSFSSYHSGCRLVYLSGRNGSELDSVTFHYEC